MLHGIIRQIHNFICEYPKEMVQLWLGKCYYRMTLWQSSGFGFTEILFQGLPALVLPDKSYNFKPVAPNREEEVPGSCGCRLLKSDSCVSSAADSMLLKVSRYPYRSTCWSLLSSGLSSSPYSEMYVAVVTVPGNGGTSWTEELLSSSC